MSQRRTRIWLDSMSAAYRLEEQFPPVNDLHHDLQVDLYRRMRLPSRPLPQHWRWAV